MKEIFFGLFSAIRFLTRIPLSFVKLENTGSRYLLVWFPLVGAFVGFLVALIHVLALHYWSPLISATLSVGFGLLLTGGLHEDGVADSVDGLGGRSNNGNDIDEIVRIMHDSHIGAYGAMALWVVLTLRWAILIALSYKALLAMPLAMAWSRWSGVILVKVVSPISLGLSSSVRVNTHKSSVLFASLVVLLVTFVVYIMGYATVWIPMLVAIITVFLWVIYLRKYIGGQSGDLVGAGMQLVELVILLSVLVR